MRHGSRAYVAGFGAVLVAGTAGASASLAPDLQWGAPVQVLVVALIVATLVAIGYRRRVRGWLLSPSVAFPVIYTIYFGLGSVNLPVNQRDDVSGGTFFLRHVTVQVPVLALIGLVAYFVGVVSISFITSRHVALTRTNSSVGVGSWPAGRLERAAAAALVGAVVFAAATFARSGVPGLSSSVAEDRITFAAENGALLTGYYTLSIVAAALGVLAALAPSEAHLHRRRALMAAILILVSLGSILLGGRGALIEVMLFVTPLVMLARSGGTRKRQLLFIVVVLLVFFGSYGIYRDSQYVGGFEVFSRIYGNLGLPPWFVPVAPIYSYWRLPIVTLGRLVEILPSQGFGNGRFLLAGLGGFAPGHNPGSDVLFKDMIGLQFSGGAGLPGSLLGVLYGDFGFSGIVVGMAAIGSSSSLLYRRLMANNSPGTMLAYAYLMKVVLWSLFAGPLPYTTTVTVPLVLVIGASYARSRGLKRRLAAIPLWPAFAAFIGAIMLVIAAAKFEIG